MKWAIASGAGIMHLSALPDILEGKSNPKPKKAIPEPIFYILFKEVLVPNKYLKDHNDEDEIVSKGGNVEVLSAFSGTQSQLRKTYKDELYQRIHENDRFVSLEKSISDITTKLHHEPKYVLSGFSNISSSSVVGARDGDTVVLAYALGNEWLLPNLVFAAYGTVAKRRNGTSSVEIFDFDFYRTNDFINSPPTGIIESKTGTNFTELNYTNYWERRLLIQEINKSPVMDLLDITSSQDNFLSGLKKQKIVYDKNWKPVY